MDEGQEHFLKYWFSGFENGLGQVDAAAQETILRACGLACAHSFTAQAFQEAWQQSTDLDTFLVNLAGKFRAVVFEKVDERNIAITYTQCFCDLVRLGWVKAPVLCKCSATNLKENFESSLGRPVQVEMKSSILGGAEKCLFEVELLDGKE